MSTPDIDRILSRRGIRHNTLGPTGARMFCDRLENTFGLQGRFFCLHDRDSDTAIDNPAILQVRVNGDLLGGNRAACMWYPSHSRRQVNERGLRVVEHKFITWDDVACDVVRLTNTRRTPITVTLELTSEMARGVTRAGRDYLAAARTLYGRPMRMLLAMPSRGGSSSDRLTCEVKLAPDEETSLLITFAVAQTQGKAQQTAARWARCEDPLAEHTAQYRQWFADNCPDFDCPDERFVRMWWYRWFLLRHNLAEPRTGLLPRRVFYEGRHGGYARPVTFSAPLVLNEARWLRDPGFAYDEMLSFIETQPDHGLYRDLWADRQRGLEPGKEGNPDPGYAEFLPRAFWDVLRVHPSRELLPPALESMMKNIAGLQKLRDTNHNLLLNPGGHHMGQEHAASFTFFHDFSDWYDYTELERVDYSAMFYASLDAAARAAETLGRTREMQWHDGLAERCREAVLERMWDPADGFFYSIREADGLFARCIEANGLFPFAFDMVPDEETYHRAVGYLLDPEHLWAPFPIATLSRHCPAFSAQPGCWGAEEKGPFCLWNGPTWPYANSIAAEAMANVLRRHTQDLFTRRRFMEFMWLYTRLMFESDDGETPLVREYYDCDCGVGFGCPDYLHSSYNDLVIRHLAGVCVRDDNILEIDPLVEGWSYFKIENILYRGHQVTLVWDTRPEGKRYAGFAEGLTVVVDGEVAAHAAELSRLTVDLDAPAEA